MATIEAVRLAMNAVAEATPATRRERLVDLMTAGVELQDRMKELYDPDTEDFTVGGWLQRADAYLTAHPNLPDFREREDLYLRRLMEYQEMHTVLGSALMTIGRETKATKPVTTIEAAQQAMAL